jgi:Mg-chelatase subunit ChlD
MEVHAMAYKAVATGKSPALIIYLLDISGSMDDRLEGIPKIEHVNQAIERLLLRMVRLSTKGEIISPRYRIGMIAYSDSPIDILGGILTIDEIVQFGKPTLSATNSTNTAAAFEMARYILRREIAEVDHSHISPAPMICHLTDGQFTGPDPEPIAREIIWIKRFRAAVGRISKSAQHCAICASGVN